MPVLSTPPAVLTSSAFARRALGLARVGRPATTAGPCAFCGRAIATGDLCLPFRPGESFTDGAALAGRGSADGRDYLCADCAALTPKAVMLKTQQVVITAAGAWPAASTANLRFILEAIGRGDPRFAAPLLITQGVTKLAHLIWRTPLTLDAGALALRLAGAVHLVRMRLLDAAIEDWRSLPAPPAGSPIHPFMFLGRKWSGLSRLLIARPERWALLPGPARVRAQSLGPGELWALTALLSPDDPVEPAPFRLGDATE